MGKQIEGSASVIAERLVALLNARGLVCATAESCTGGGVGSAITSVPGSSSVFAGGVISYANEVKRDVLGVPESVLAEKGAVSSECAAAMAVGVRRLLNVDVAVSLTGIAGPGGGSAEKPVHGFVASIHDFLYAEIFRTFCSDKIVNEFRGFHETFVAFLSSL